MTEYCPSGCEVGECKLKKFGPLFLAATELAAEVGATEAQTNAIVDAHGAMVNNCAEYATADTLARFRQEEPLSGK